VGPGRLTLSRRGLSGSIGAGGVRVGLSVPALTSRVLRGYVRVAPIEHRYDRPGMVPLATQTEDHRPYFL
jgi:hypothetical protein